MKVTFIQAENEAEEVMTFRFRPQKPVRYLAGQFTEIFLPHRHDNRGPRRWFTLSSSPSEELLGITTKYTEGSSTFKKELLELKAGTELDLAEPMGDFVLPKDQTIPILFVAAGMGITPVRSMVKWLVDNKQKRNIKLIYITKAKHMAFLPLFKSFGLDAAPSGRVKTQQIIDLAGADRQIYISGPEEMVETYYKELKTSGVPEERIVADYFPGYKSQG